MRVGFLAGFLVMSAACADIEDPYLGADPVLSPTTIGGSASGEPEDRVGKVEEASLNRDFAPPRPEGYLPSVVVGSRNGLLAQDETGLPFSLTAPVGQVVTNRLVDDFFGGLVVQQQPGTIVWHGASAGSPVVLDSVGELLDVGFLDATGAIHALILVEGSRVDALRLDGGEPTTLISLEEGQTILDLSASSGLHAVVIADENCGDLLFFNSAGEPLDLAGPGRPVCVAASRSAYGNVALSPDRSSVVYTELMYRGDGVVASTRVVGQDLGSETELFNFEIGEAGENISSLSFDGQRIAYIRSEGATSTVELVDPLSRDVAEVLPIEDPQAVTFARQPLLVGRS